MALAYLPNVPSVNPPVQGDETTVAVCRRVEELVEKNSDQWSARDRIRKICNGGPEGLAALIGSDVPPNSPDIPVANMILNAVDSLGAALGERPDTKVDPPPHLDSERARKAAEKRARIVTSYDDRCELELILPQMGRWLPGYGFAAFTLGQRYDINGEPYPHVSLRNSYSAFPGEWGADQDPPDIAFVRLIAPSTLAQLFPHAASKVLSKYERLKGGIILDRGRGMGTSKGWARTGGWESQSNSGIEVYEYINHHGTWHVVPSENLLLQFVPNPLRQGPTFQVVKRYAFDELVGAYDHTIGILAAIARLNVLAIMSTEDAVFAETNVAGELLAGKYVTGRRAVNMLAPGTRVEKQNQRVPYEVFQQIDRLERQYRTTAKHPLQEDSISPNSFVTGQGLEQLGAPVGRHIAEYHRAISRCLTKLDAKRLEWDETIYGPRKKSLTGTYYGARYSETYVPERDIAGNWNTRRVYGVMAGFDEPTKIIGALNLLDRGIIDRDTVREQIHGLDDHTKVANRVRNAQVEGLLMQAMASQAEQGNPEVLIALVNLLEEGSTKALLTKTIVEPLMAQMQQAEEEAAAPGGGGPVGAPPPPQEILAMLQGGAGGATPAATGLVRQNVGGKPQMGVQSVSRATPA